MIDRAEKIRGAVLACAVGDAMGGCVDKLSWAEIRDNYGDHGLLGYALDDGVAEITSHTQILAYCLNVLLLAHTRSLSGGEMPPLEKYLALGLREWSRTQQYSDLQRNYCWVTKEPALRRKNCMDHQLLDALSRETLGTPSEPVMLSAKPSCLTEAVAVVLAGKLLGMDGAEQMQLSARAAAFTHGVAEGYLPSAAAAGLLQGILDGRDQNPAEWIDGVTEQMEAQFGALGKLPQMLTQAAQLADSHTPRQEAMESLGCSTASQVLAGAVYAYLASRNDYDTALITAINHSGRSAAVGALTGAFIGAKLGFAELPFFYLECLEAGTQLRELAEDVVSGCPMGVSESLFDDDWERKYRHAGG